MACGDSSFDVIKPVFSDGTTSPTFVAFARQRVSDWTRARLSMTVDALSGNLTLETAARYANTEQGLVSATPVAMPTSAVSRTSDGQSFGTDFKDLNKGYQLVEFGVDASNTSTGNPEMATVTLTIDLQE